MLQNYVESAKVGQAININVDSKYKTWYDNIINRAKTRTLPGYTEKHHILPRACGGTDSKNNIVKLTAREHYICHMLLLKIMTGKDRIKMISAAWFLAGKMSKKNSKLYESLKTQRKILVGTKIRKTMVGRKYNTERCRNISKAKKGQKYRPQTHEHLKKLSEAKKGKSWLEIYGPENAAIRLANMKKRQIHLKKRKLTQGE